MSSLQKAISNINMLVGTAKATATRSQREDSILSSGVSSTAVPVASSRYKERYNLFRGWVYAAINAISSEAASMSVNVARRKKSSKKRPAYQAIKSLREQKEVYDYEEVLSDDSITTVIEQPNEFQTRVSFVYSFVANLCLTGWSFVVVEAKKGDGDLPGIRLYALPTTWIHPNHRERPFGSFFVGGPASSKADWVELPRENVVFAHLPNPANPLGGYAPAAAVLPALRIDDHIQTTQEKFFERGIFPSVVITVGKDPHPEAPGGGWRPRLTPEQRRQIATAIKKLWAGVENYGEPAIVDGLIERIDRLSATQHELGWQRSEETIRTRILSAFGVHPFILGESVPGSYAQSAIIESRFYRRVNFYTEMLSNVVTRAISNVLGNEDYIVWWDRAEPTDPSLHYTNLRYARSIGDISQKEFRALMGLPDDPDGQESAILPSQLAPLTQLLVQIGAGAIPGPQAEALLMAAGLPRKLARQIANPPKGVGGTESRAPQGGGEEGRSEGESIDELESELRERSLQLLQQLPQVSKDLLDEYDRGIE